MLAAEAKIIQRVTPLVLLRDDVLDMESGPALFLLTDTAVFAAVTSPVTHLFAERCVHVFQAAANIRRALA